MPYGDGSELQLLELSGEGDRKLTRTCKSMPRMPTFDLQVETIGNDLLRGALGLQGSINELRRLQDLKTMSQRMDHRKLDLVGGKFLAELARGSKSYAINDLEEEKLVRTTASWRPTKDELKKVIRDSLHGQNLLSASPDDEKGLSSRSLGFSSRTNQFSASSGSEGRKSSNAAATKAVKMRTPSLIARLMGLEDLPSEAAQSAQQKQTLSEMIEKEKSERLLNCDHFKRGKFEMDDDQDKVLKRERAQQVKSVFYHVILDETRKQPRPADTNKGRSLQKTEGETLQANGVGKWIVDLEAMPCFDRESQEHSLDNNARQQVATATKLVPEAQTLNISQETPKDAERKLVGSFAKRRADYFRQKQRPALDHRQQKKDATKPSKRADGKQKPGLNAPNSMSLRYAKATATQMSPAKSGRTAPASPDKGLVTAIPKAEAPPKQTTDSPMKTMSTNSSSPTRERKPGNIQAKKNNNIKPLKQHGARSTYGSAKTDAATAITARPDSMMSRKKKKWLKSSIRENVRKDKKVIDAVMPPTSRVGGHRMADATIVKPSNKEDKDRSTREIEDLRTLLLSSKEIVDLAHKLCSDAHPIVSDEKEDLSSGATSANQYLACAGELIARQRYLLDLSKHPMWRASSWSLPIYASLDQLVEAIRKELGMLAEYSKVDDDVVSKDSLYVVLERDLKCDRMRLNSMWDSGWWTGICMEAAGEVVDQVEELILSEFIEEFAVDILFHH